MNFLLPDALSANLRQFTQTRLALFKPSTRKNTYSKVLRFLSWAVTFQHGKFTRWTDVCPTLVDNFLCVRCKCLTRKGTYVNIHTVERDLIALKEWVVWNEEQEMTGPIRSPYIMRPLPAVPHEEVHFLSPEEEQAILDRSRWIYEGARGLRFPEERKGRQVLTNARQTGWERGAFRLYFLLMMRQGLRPFEAIKLRWDDMSLYSKPAFMRLQPLLNSDSGRSLKTPKSADAITIARAATTLDEWSGPCEKIDLLAELRRFATNAHGPWVFGTEDPFTKQVVFPDDDFIWRALRYELKDKKLRAYSCRHTVGTRMSARGFSAEEIARVLRNSPRVCERFYIAGTRERDAFDINTARRVQIRA